MKELTFKQSDILTYYGDKLCVKHEIFSWMTENIYGDWRYSYLDNDTIALIFNNDEEAIAFKIMWVK